jgi:hypothetical protein
MKIHEKELNIGYPNSVKSLNWIDNALIDWAVGGQVYHLDGRIQPSFWNIGYSRLDSAILSPSSDYAIVYEKLGTKGVILDARKSITISSDGNVVYTFPRKVIREINRSLESADEYEYPITIFTLPDGHEVLAHCPDNYNQMVIEELESGKRLNIKSDNPASDYYYSRLVANKSGTKLISSGWIWHPISDIMIFDVNALLNGNQILDTGELLCPPIEMSSADYIDDNHLLIACSSQPQYILDDSWLPPCALTIYDINEARYMKTMEMEEPAGTVFALNPNLAISLYDHLKLIDLETGAIVQRWSDINTGKQESCIPDKTAPQPPIAVDRENGRIAIATPDSIRVIGIDQA